jgi:hypothetical protein
MAHCKLGRFDRARADFDRAVKWRREHRDLPDPYPAELDAVQAEAQSVVDGPAPVLPANVFAPLEASCPP